MKYLTQEMEAAAKCDIDVDMDDDEPELIADHTGERSGREMPQPQPQPQLSQQAASDDFWAKMNNMLDMKHGRLETQVATAMNKMENRLGEWNARESEDRKHENASIAAINQTELKATNSRIDNVMASLEQIKTGRTAPTPPTTPTAHATTGTWRPKRLILAGWADKSERNTVENEAITFVQSLPGYLRSRCLAAWAPARWPSS